MREILCFGDSNTYGYIPGHYEKAPARYPWGIRWTSLLNEKLGKEDYRVIEEGLCGRTTVFEDSFRAHRNGSEMLPAILEKTNEAGIPVYGSEIEQVKIGCVASAGLDYVQLGIQTGLMAAKVLTGEATCEDLPYETISEYQIYINSQELDAMGIAVPEALADKAIEATAE